MSDSNIIQIKEPAAGMLADVLKHGAQQLLAQAIETEVAELLERYGSLT